MRIACPEIIPDGQTAAQHPAVAPIFMPNTILMFEVRDQPTVMGREARLQAFSIIGMHAIDPFSQRCADIPFGVAQHRLPARREVHLIVADPIPTAHRWRRARPGRSAPRSRVVLAPLASQR